MVQKTIIVPPGPRTLNLFSASVLNFLELKIKPLTSVRVKFSIDLSWGQI